MMKLTLILKMLLIYTVFSLKVTRNQIMIKEYSLGLSAGSWLPFKDVANPRFEKLYWKYNFKSSGSWNDVFFTETNKNSRFTKVFLKC